MMEETPGQRVMHRLILVEILLALLFINTAAIADESVKRDVFLQKADASELKIAQISLTKNTEGGYQTRVVLAENVFGDHFLSMRPFKCTETEGYMLCHLPYPYENKREINANDLTDLEYDLLFIRRSPTDYGIDPWNGVYFKLEGQGDPGSGQFTGELYEINLDILAAPPENGNLRPIQLSDLHEAESQSHAWPNLIIR